MKNVKELIAEITNGAYDAAFRKLYADEDTVLAAQKARYNEALTAFGAMFGENRAVRLYSTPGRTEIGGNHTDHNNGIVLAAAVNLDIIAVVSPNEDNTIRVKSCGFDKIDVIDTTDLSVHEKESGMSASLVRGVAAGIAAENGIVHGFDAYTTSNVLRGSGLSSSAAFEVIIGQILNCEYNDGRFSAVEIAKISQFAENKYFGKPCGLMDQTACAVGSTMTIDFKDPTAPIVNKVPFALAKHKYSLCITDTKGSHADLTEDYASIRSEMESVASFFGKKVLREVDEETFVQKIPQIRKKVGDRAILRALHFFAECRRAPALYEAVKEDRFADFLSMIIDGGHSSFEYNQNAYSNKKVQEQGVSLGVALSERLLAGKGAWRLHGGGFAGTIQAFVPDEQVENYRSLMNGVFGDGSCYVLNVRNYGAVEVLPNM